MSAEQSLSLQNRNIETVSVWVLRHAPVASHQYVTVIFADRATAFTTELAHFSVSSRWTVITSFSYSVLTALFLELGIDS